MELYKIIENLKELTPNNKHIKSIFLGGSYALKHIYNVLKREPNDIDIIIYNFNQKHLDWIKKHFSTFCDKAYSYNNININNEKNIFYINAYMFNKPLKINFITYSFGCPFPSYTKYNDLDVVPLKAIIDAKLEYNRNKDKSDLLDIILELNNPTNSHKLNTI